ADAPLAVDARWERPLAAAGGEATLLVRIVAPAAPTAPTARRAPVDVAFVVDRSGSMAGDKLALVKRAVDVAVALLRDEDRAALIVYDHAVETLQRLDRATPRTKAAIRLALHGVDPGGSTNLSGGWLAGCAELGGGMDDESAVRVRRAILLTDGHANVGITDPGELTHHATEIRRRGVGTTTLGVGLGFDEDLLGGLAEAGGGNFRYVARADQLRAFFAEELQELLTVAATGLTVTLTLPPGVRGRLVNAFPAERVAKTITVAVGDVSAGDEVCLVFALTTRAGASGTRHPVQVRADWTATAADERQTAAPALPELRLADAATVAREPADPLVAEQSAIQRAAIERREALRLDRQGRHAESRARMGAAAGMLMAAPATDAVRLDLDSIRLLADADAPYDEHTHKRGHEDALRRSRGKRDERGGGR
ncbi:MAG: hypothetical protein AVDCRST_MAG73-2190, partial [uncultured Thermomicrobiales bacterium]